MICPLCGNEERAKNSMGIPMPGKILPVIFEAVDRAGAEGISTDRLYAMLYAHKTRPPQRSVIKQHVARINDLLVETDWRIYGKEGSYKFVRRKPGE